MYADENSVIVAQKGRKKKGTSRLQTMCQPEVADPGEVGGPKLQTSGHQVAEVVQGVLIAPHSRMFQPDTVDILEGPAGGTLGDRPWRPADAVAGIRLSCGISSPRWSR